MSLTRSHSAVNWSRSVTWHFTTLTLQGTWRGKEEDPGEEAAADKGQGVDSSRGGTAPHVLPTSPPRWVPPDWPLPPGANQEMNECYRLHFSLGQLDWGWCHSSLSLASPTPTLQGIMYPTKRWSTWEVVAPPRVYRVYTVTGLDTRSLITWLSALCKHCVNYLSCKLSLL